MNHPEAILSPAATDVTATLTFIVPEPGRKPYFESSALTGGEPRVHFRTEAREVTVHDMRPMAGELSLDGSGFELHAHPTTVDDLYDDEAVTTAYAAELRALLRAVTGADRVEVFDCTRRSDAPERAANPDGPRGPATRAHVDYTVDSGPQRARDALGTRTVDEVLEAGGRIVQVNVWRPIRGPVRRAPLALGDASSFSAQDLVATDHVFPARVGEIYQVAYGPRQRWYWVPGMTREEVVLIKGWDSLDDGRARFTPHSAFDLPHQDPHAPPRESIEARTYLVFEGAKARPTAG